MIWAVFYSFMIYSFCHVPLQSLLQDREKDFKALEKAKKEIDSLKDECENSRKDSENAAQQVTDTYVNTPMQACTCT
jgi:hypothetical protein